MIFISLCLFHQRIHKYRKPLKFPLLFWHSFPKSANIPREIVTTHTYTKLLLGTATVYFGQRVKIGISQSNNSASLDISDIKGLLIFGGMGIKHYSSCKNTWKPKTQRQFKTIVQPARAVMSNARLDEV